LEDLGVQLIGAELLEAAQSWFSTKSSELSQRGISAEFENSLEGRDPESVRLILETGDRLGELIVWANGMVELSFAEIATGVVTPEHRRITSRAELDAALTSLSEWVA
jgi:hypothetical protein